jgi:hypothetical protein
MAAPATYPPKSAKCIHQFRVTEIERALVTDSDNLASKMPFFEARPTKETQEMGKFNSSATRVAPFFQALIDRDKSGKTWLSSILKLLPNRCSFTPELLLEPGEITKSQFGKGEFCLNPPLGFLKWMVQHPDELNWPRYEIKDKHILDMRERLMLRGSYEGIPQVREEAVESAKAEIDCAIGAPGIGGCGWLRRWWVLEGQTHVDCYIQTTRLRLFAEGKRTEKLSRSTSWYRNATNFCEI